MKQLSKAELLYQIGRLVTASIEHQEATQFGRSDMEEKAAKELMRARKLISLLTNESASDEELQEMLGWSN
jgi:hypothetical protein